MTPKPSSERGLDQPSAAADHRLPRSEVPSPHSSPEWFRARRFYYEHVSNQGTVKVSGDATDAVHGLVEQYERVSAAFDLLGRSVVSMEEHERLKEQLETQQAQIEALLRVVGDYEQRLGIPEFMRWQASSPASRPVGTVKDGTLHWVDGEGVPHSGPFVDSNQDRSSDEA